MKRLLEALSRKAWPIVLALAVASLLASCATKLAQGGGYAPGVFSVSTDPGGVTTTNFVATVAPDKAFFVVDSAYYLAWSTLDGIFTFERDNRIALWKISPSIKHALDALRPAAWNANVRYLSARAAYLSNPVPNGLTALQSIVAEIQNLTAAAQAALAPAKT